MPPTTIPVHQQDAQAWADLQRVNLKRLVDSVLIRANLEVGAMTLMKSINKQLQDRPLTLSHLAQAPLALFPHSTPNPRALSLKDIARSALDLYQNTVHALPPRFRRQIGPLSADFIHYDNRQIRQAAKEIDVMARALQKSTDAAIRNHGQSLWLASRLLSVTAPPVNTNKINECVFCHRHTIKQTACSHHRVNGKYTASTLQREQLHQEISALHSALQTRLEDSPDDLKTLMNSTSDAQCIKALARLTKKCLSPATQACFSSAISHLDPAAALLPQVISRWHHLPEVSDAPGISAIDNTGTPAAALFLHLTRFDAFQRMGGDLPKRARTQ